MLLAAMKRDLKQSGPSYDDVPFLFYALETLYWAVDINVEVSELDLAKT